MPAGAGRSAAWGTVPEKDRGRQDAHPGVFDGQIPIVADVNKPIRDMDFLTRRGRTRISARPTSTAERGGRKGLKDGFDRPVPRITRAVRLSGISANNMSGLHVLLLRSFENRDDDAFGSVDLPK